MEAGYYLTLDFMLKTLFLKMLPYCSMSDEEQESGCDAVGGSPTSGSSGHDSPFAESGFVGDTRQDTELVTSASTEPRPAVCTVGVPPVGLENGLSADEHMANTGT